MIPLTPIVGVVAAAVAFGGGWLFRGYKADADLMELKLAQTLAVQAANDAARSVIDSERARGDAIAADLEVVRQKVRVVYRDKILEVNRAEKSDSSVCSPSSDWLRIYNDALRGQGDKASASGKPAGSS